MWKLFLQKQQDYCRKLQELGEFVGGFERELDKTRNDII